MKTLNYRLWKTISTFLNFLHDRKYQDRDYTNHIITLGWTNDYAILKRKNSMLTYYVAYAEQRCNVLSNNIEGGDWTMDTNLDMAFNNNGEFRGFKLAGPRLVDSKVSDILRQC